MILGVRIMADQLKDVDKSIAFILELVGGIFGFLGIGYMYAGDITQGVIRLIAWFCIVVFAWIVIAVLTAFLIGICFIPFMLIAQIGIPVWSAFSIKKKLEETYPTG